MAIIHVLIAADSLIVRQTIAQDQASSTVFGLPREAISLHAAQIIAPLDYMATVLCHMARRDRGDDEKSL